MTKFLVVADTARDHEGIMGKGGDHKRRWGGWLFFMSIVIFADNCIVNLEEEWREEVG